MSEVLLEEAREEAPATTDTLPYLRNREKYEKLTELADALSPGNIDEVVTTDGDIEVNLVPSDPTERFIRFHNRNDGEAVEVPVTERGLEQLASWLEIPSKFLLRLDRDLAQELVEPMLRRHGEEVKIAFTEDRGILEIRDPELEVVGPRVMVDVAAKIIGDRADVVNVHNTNRSFGFDVVVPVDSSVGIAGDRQVGDLTVGGLRFFKDIQRNLAPSIQPFAERLECTNGMTFVDPDLEISIKGSTVPEIIAEMERVAETAFEQVESRIKGFYELREQRVTNPERKLLRIIEEQGIPGRIGGELVKSVAALGEEVSMFDIVNHITHLANEASIAGRLTSRNALQEAAGAVVNDHHRRCPTCLHSIARSN